MTTLSLLGVCNLVKTFCVVLRDYGHVPLLQVLVLRCSAVKRLVAVVMLNFLTLHRAAFFLCAHLDARPLGQLLFRSCSLDISYCCVSEVHVLLVFESLHINGEVW